MQIFLKTKCYCNKQSFLENSCLKKMHSNEKNSKPENRVLEKKLEKIETPESVPNSYQFLSFQVSCFMNWNPRMLW